MEFGFYWVVKRSENEISCQEFQTTFNSLYNVQRHKFQTTKRVQAQHTTVYTADKNKISVVVVKGSTDIRRKRHYDKFVYLNSKPGRITGPRLRLAGVGPPPYSTVQP